MDKKMTRAYIIYIIIGILYVIYAGVLYYAHVENRAPSQAAYIWDSKMKKTEKDGSIFYSTLLPTEDISGKVIGYDSSHMLLEVTIGDEIVYSVKNDSKWVKTTGYRWNFISFSKYDAGKRIVFKVTPAYSECVPKGSFYYGTGIAVEHLVIKERLLRFLVTSTILVVGFVLFIYVIFIEKNMNIDNGLFNFTIFAILLGVWLICETQILELFLPCQVAIVFLDHIALMIMPVPFLLFLRQMYKNKDSIIWSVYCYFNCALVGIRILLQIFGIYDLRETLILTHISIGIFVVLVFGLSIHEIVVNKIDKQMKVNIFCVLVIMITTVVELLKYRITGKSAHYGSMGFLFYILVMGIFILRNSRKMLMQAKEGEIYRRLAYTDGLTGMYNRTAFIRDTDNRFITDENTTQKEIMPTTLFMFDLNDLKKCNDNYGHDYGDRYITMVSEGLKKIFETFGSCYRMGGDEFCAITSDTSVEGIDKILKELENFLIEVNRQTFVVPVSVATGYAVYNPECDKSLDDTMRRADEMMYKNKQEMKKG